MKRKIITGVFAFFLLLLLLCTGLYLGREAMLRRYVEKKIAAANAHYDVTIAYRSLRMPGISTVELGGLSVVPAGQDTLLCMRRLRAELSPANLLRLETVVRRLTVDSLEIRGVKRKGIANYDFLFRRKVSTGERLRQTDFSGQVSTVFRELFNLLPSAGELKNCTFSLLRDSTYTEVRVPRLQLEQNRFVSSLSVLENGERMEWLAKGVLQGERKTVEVSLCSRTKEKVVIPYIYSRYGVSVALDTLTVRLQEFPGKEKGGITIAGYAGVSGLALHHPALSPDTIRLEQGECDYRLNIGKDVLELDSLTEVSFNCLTFHPYVRAIRKNKWHLTFSVDKPWFPAGELFSSLPEGLFDNLKGLETEGELAYHFLLDVDFGRLDSLRFESALDSRRFRIKNFGQTNLAKMSEPFVYTAYEKGMPVRSFTVGPGNPGFTPLDSISSYLQMAVLQSEDGAFFYHRGFLIDAMREALICDLQTGSFVRGGSTITMQLVKNVFLNRNKNIARKLEEALIVWLIETQHLTSKQRMFEVYLNIAEWGPLIYGVQEASAYYFNKRPSELSVNEAIFLASIIPKPKRFRSSFSEEMKLKENQEGYFRLIGSRLQKKGVITEEEAAAIRPDIEITGKARREFSLSQDSMVSVLKERMDK